MPSSKKKPVKSRIAGGATFEVAKRSDIPEVARLITLAFAGTLERSTKWVKDNGLENIRVLREGKTIPACLRRIEMGQYFGGKRVPLCGIAGVATAPESRGKGHARRMMEACVREMHDRGEAIGGLYCSTQALYRQSGFEQAGHRFITKVPVARLLGGSKARNTIVLKESDQKRIEACYRTYASVYNGMLDRTEYIWKRIKERVDGKSQGYGVLDERGGLAGYLFMEQTRDAHSIRQELQLSDLAFTTPEAGRQLIAFLADYEPMADFVTLGGGPLHPLLTLLPQQRYEVKLKDFWMLRVVDVKRALEARGYSPAVRARVVLNITDETIPANTGKWRLDLEDGRANVRKSTGSERTGVSCGIRGLAAMYSGLYSPRQASAIGLCAGDEKSLDVLGGVFSGGTPWMSDHY
ncbi:MAG: GNAT family N-acetyltransferase [Phycisphaerae bacterium]|nr:GNAT family N-acetyltransferase [Phycisphaerae bacterium]